MRVAHLEGAAHERFERMGKDAAQCAVTRCADTAKIDGHLTVGQDLHAEWIRSLGVQYDIAYDASRILNGRRERAGVIARFLLYGGSSG